jgi:hypothetical protein
VPVKSVTKVKNNMKPEEELMNNTDLIFTITIEDMQQIAINGSIGRELTDEELQKIKTNMNANLSHYAEIALKLALELE